MNRIINVKPQMVKTSKLNEDFHKNHMRKKKMILDHNQGIFIEDLIEVKRKFREGSVGAAMYQRGTNTPVLPSIQPNSSQNTGSRFGGGSKMSNTGQRYPSNSQKIR
jgi:hypothetical protein